MYIMHAFDTRLNGTLPSTIGELVSLNEWWVQNTFITGSLPSTIGNMTLLAKIYLQNTHLSGSIPPEIGNLPWLLELKLHNNKLTGPIPEEMGNIPNLQYLDMSYNNLNGTIPLSLFNSPSLNQLILKNNKLSGEIPDLSKLASCLLIDFSSNQLIGTIPPSITNLSFAWLDVSSNRLSDPVPTLTSMDNETFSYLYFQYYQFPPPIISSFQNSLSTFIFNFKSYYNLAFGVVVYDCYGYHSKCLITKYANQSYFTECSNPCSQTTIVNTSNHFLELTDLQGFPQITFNDFETFVYISNSHIQLIQDVSITSFSISHSVIIIQASSIFVHDTLSMYASNSTVKDSSIIVTGVASIDKSSLDVPNSKLSFSKIDEIMDSSFSFLNSSLTILNDTTMTNGIFSLQNSTMKTESVNAFDSFLSFEDSTLNLNGSLLINYCFLDSIDAILVIHDSIDSKLSSLSFSNSEVTVGGSFSMINGSLQLSNLNLVIKEQMIFGNTTITFGPSSSIIGKSSLWMMYSTFIIDWNESSETSRTLITFKSLDNTQININFIKFQILNLKQQNCARLENRNLAIIISVSCESNPINTALIGGLVGGILGFVLIAGVVIFIVYEKNDKRMLNALEAKTGTSN
eukprot:TRINITY_DN10722_c0_g2_i1.p1 TRINITY_DN10722_c0_g2~~TRINITY_DN10722_c0_g2_i1.p1  ORF type:complete len:629 (+),score=125.25 TRINITY_DN10722_c0_g2_i1:617-2503(+)